MVCATMTLSAAARTVNVPIAVGVGAASRLDVERTSSWVTLLALCEQAAVTVNIASAEHTLAVFADFSVIVMLLFS